MIGGMVEHDGNHALAVHLANVNDNELISFRVHGLSGNSIADAIAELRLMGMGCRTRKPVLHTWASPSKAYSDTDWETHRSVFEAEFGLEGFPCLEVFHLKHGKGGRGAAHVHRIYLRVDVDGRAVRTNHSAIRMEKTSRLAEHMAGERFTSGSFNKAVIARLRQEGRQDVADAMVRAGLGETSAVASPRSSERAMTERLHDLAADEVWRRAATAWRRSDTGISFKAALNEAGLRIAMGNSCPVVVGPGGAVHPLLRAINKGGQRQRGTPICKADLDDRLKGVVLPPASEIAPLVGFNPGPFAITNLARLPADHPPKQELGVDMATPDRTLSPTRFLTPEQETALNDLENALVGTVAIKAAAVRQAIEMGVIEKVTRRKHKEQLLRIEAEKASWDRPGIGAPDWREAYRAQLAGLPRKYGSYLKWVDQLDAARQRVRLNSGNVVTLEPTRAWADAGDGDASQIMIAHVLARGWTRITINGRDRWRHEMARAATRAGLTVIEADLLVVVEAERACMQDERLIDAWWQCRVTVAHASSQVRAEARADFLRAMEQVVAHLSHFDLADENRRRLLLNDVDSYERYRAPRDHQGSQSLRPRPG